MSVPELAIGRHERSPGRTVTEGDVTTFAGLSGDYNALHTDDEVARASPFGRRVAHGLLVTSIASGLFTRTALSQELQPRLVALVGLTTRFLAPVFPGDTVHVEATVTGLRPTRDGTRQVVTVRRDVLTSDGTRVQEIETQMLIGADA
jgi:acyl dehydratase